MMQEKVTDEGKKEKELYERYMCYCKTGKDDLEASITASKAKIENLNKSIADMKATKGQLQLELEEHNASKAEAKQTLAKAKEIRAGEASTFAKESSDGETNIKALGKAITALENGVYSSFLQTSEAETLRRLTMSAVQMSASALDTLSSFLSEGEGGPYAAGDYAPKSGQIIGILKQMKDTFEKNLKETVAEEQQSIKEFGSLAEAKQKEYEAHVAAIEEKLPRMGNAGVDIVNMEEDLEGTQKSLSDDEKFLADLDEGCKTKDAEWAERSKIRSMELVALAETITILNEDDSLELFKKTLPSPTLLQMAVTSKEVRRRAGAALAKARRDPRMDMILLALKSHKISFEKVITMIDDMVALLKKEQVDDDEKKAYCEAELDKAEDELKVLDQTVTDLNKAIEAATELVATLVSEIKALVEGIAELDENVKKATENRKAKHEEYVQVMADNAKAKELITAAQNRLNQFYNQALHTTTTTTFATEGDRIYANFGSPGSFLQIKAREASDSEAAPPPPPETWGAYKKKGEEHMGVTEMLNLLKAAIDKDTQTGQVEEKDAQAEYEKMMEDSAAKRAADTEAIATKEATKADFEAEIAQKSLEKNNTVKAAMAKAEQIAGLHAECDWLTANFETRKEARAGEIESLFNAKAVLSGSDYSLVEMSSRHMRLRGRIAA